MTHLIQLISTIQQLQVRKCNRAASRGLALRRALAKFEARFATMESLAREQGGDLQGRTAEQLDALWRQAKEHVQG